MTEDSWEEQINAVWASGHHTDADLVAAVEGLARACPYDDGTADFERAGSFDATDQIDRAIPLYRRALAAGLTGPRRRQAIIQLASSLRNIGDSAESVDLLTAEMAATSDELDDAVRAFLALALADVGREREAVRMALTALKPHLAMYGRAVGEYADLLIGPGDVTAPDSPA